MKPPGPLRLIRNRGIEQTHKDGGKCLRQQPLKMYMGLYIIKERNRHSDNWVKEHAARLQWQEERKNFNRPHECMADTTLFPIKTTQLMRNLSRSRHIESHHQRGRPASVYPLMTNDDWTSLVPRLPVVRQLGKVQCRAGSEAHDRASSRMHTYSA